MAKPAREPEFLSELTLAPVLCAGHVIAVNGLDGALEGPPENISFDIEYWLDGISYRQNGVICEWRLHDNDIDGVTAKVYPVKVGTKIVVWVGADQVVALFPERIALRACPSGGA